MSIVNSRIDDYSVGILPLPTVHTVAANTSRVLTEGTGADRVTVNQPLSASLSTKTSATTTFTTSDCGKWLRLGSSTGAGTHTYTIATGFPTDSILMGVQAGDKNILFDPDPGVTINIPDGLVAVTFGKGSVFALVNIGGNTWDCFGDLKDV
jgi:hypothetical protein